MFSERHPVLGKGAGKALLKFQTGAKAAPVSGYDIGL
jgi:hypothetical protein